MRFNLRKSAKDDSGFSLVFVAVGMMGFVGVSMLAIDVGMLMTARSQAQNSADAGALAGATALVYNDWNDRSATGPAAAASTAHQVALTTDQIADGHIRHRGPDLHDLTGEFVAEDQRRMHGLAGPRIPGLDVQVCAADARDFHPHQDISQTDLGNGHLDQLQPRPRLGLDERAHSTILPRRD